MHSWSCNQTPVASRTPAGPWRWRAALACSALRLGADLGVFKVARPSVTGVRPPIGHCRPMTSPMAAMAGLAAHPLVPRVAARRRRTGAPMGAADAGHGTLGMAGEGGDWAGHRDGIEGSARFRGWPPVLAGLPPHGPRRRSGGLGCPAALAEPVLMPVLARSACSRTPCRWRCLARHCSSRRWRRCATSCRTTRMPSFKCTSTCAAVRRPQQVAWAARSQTNGHGSPRAVPLVLSAKLFRNLSAVPLEALGVCILRGRDDDTVRTGGRRSRGFAWH